MEVDSSKLEREGEIIISKQILVNEECDDLLELYHKIPKSDIDVLGCRLFVKIIIPEYMVENLYFLLSNYVVVRKIDPEATIYYTVGGEVKEHTDRILYDSKIDAYSKYTLIIYLSSTGEDSGMTRIKRTKQHAFEYDDTSLKHERIWIRPLKGHCVLFNSKLSHNATESYGDKYILVTKVY